MGMIHPSIVDDVGGITGTVWNDAWETAHDTAIDLAIGAASGASSPTTTGTQTALAIPAGSGALVLYLNNASLLTIQGIVAGVPGQLLALVSKGAGQVDLAHLHASGTALGKLQLFTTSGLTSLAPGSGVAVLQYDGTLTKWRLVSHEQGAWITPAFNAARYAASAGTWTLQAGDVLGDSSRLAGRTLEWNLNLATTSVSNAGVVLYAILPGGFTSNLTGFQQSRTSDNGGANVAGLVNVVTGSPIAQLTATIPGAGYAIAVNTTSVSALIRTEVQ